MSIAEAVIFTIAALVVAAVWTFVIVQVGHERHEAIRAAVRQNINQSIALEQYVIRTLGAADIASAYIGRQHAHLLANPARPNPPVAAIDDMATRALIKEINLLDARGNLVATSIRPTPGPLNVARAPIFSQHVHDPDTGMRVNKPTPSLFIQGRHVILSRRLNHPDGSFAGIIGIHIQPAILTQLMQGAPIRETDVLSVIGLDGITRARRTGDVESFGEDLRGKRVMDMQARHPNGTYLGPSALDGRVRYFSHRRLPRYGLFVTSGVSRDAILEPVRDRTIGYAIGGILVTLMTSLAAWLLRSDIKRRIRREVEMRAANERLSEAQRVARIGDWSFDAVRGEFCWSEELSAMYERDPARKWVSFGELAAIYGSGGPETVKAALDRARVTGERQDYELIARLPSGVMSHRHVVAVPRIDSAGRMTGVHGTDQDVSSRKLVESLQEQVTYLSRLDAMSAVASTLAHELNQPLAAASNYLSGSMRIAASRNAANDALTDGLAAVQTQIQNAGDIIRRVRGMVSRRQVSAESVSLSKVVESAIEMLEAANPQMRRQVSYDLSANCTEVTADRVQLQQVLVNLIRNAWEASRDGDPQIRVSCSCGGPGEVEICVSDNGEGFPEGTGDVFSPFTTSKQEGLGLGLSISRTLVEAWGGRIRVHKTGPEGTSICFTLPRNKECGKAA